MVWAVSSRPLETFFGWVWSYQVAPLLGWVSNGVKKELIFSKKALELLCAVTRLGLY